MSEGVGYVLPKSMLLLKLGCLKAEGDSRQIKQRPFLQRDSQGAEGLMIFLLKVFQQQESVARKEGCPGGAGVRGRISSQSHRDQSTAQGLWGPSSLLGAPRKLRPRGRVPRKWTLF